MAQSTAGGGSASKVHEEVNHSTDSIQDSDLADLHQLINTYGIHEAFKQWGERFGIDPVEIDQIKAEIFARTEVLTDTSSLDGVAGSACSETESQETNDIELNDLQQLIRSFGGPHPRVPQVKKRVHDDDEVDDNEDVIENKFQKLGHPDFQNGSDFENGSAPKLIIDYLAHILASKTFKAFPCQAPGCIDHFESTKKYEEHYQAKHRHVCCECKKCYPSDHLLGLHVQESHDSFFKVKSMKQPMFECYLSTCLLKYNSPEERFIHCVDDHLFPKTFKHSTSKRDVYPKQSKKEKKSNKVKTENELVSSRMEVEEAEHNKNPSLNAEEAMDVSQGLNSSKSKKKSSQPSIPTASSSVPKPSSSHFTFGHKVASRFVPRHSFAMEKNNIEKKKTNTVSSANQDTEEIINFTDVQNVLLEDVAENTLLESHPAAKVEPEN